MVRIRLERFAYTPMGTFGYLRAPEFQCYTIELPWEFNIPYASCIPEGLYHTVWGRFNKGGYETLEVVGVPRRTRIKFHVANTIDDLLGCIGLGKELGYIDGKWGVTSSKAAFAEFIASMRGVTEASAGKAPELEICNLIGGTAKPNEV